MDVPFRRTSRKLHYPDRVAASWTETVLGEDEHGQWAALPAGSPVRRESGTVLRYRSPQLFCYPHDRWWMARLGGPDASFRAERADGTVRVFADPAPDRVDIGTPPVESDDGISFVDLVLDVGRDAGGSVMVLDEHEVDELAARWGIPPAYLVDARRSGAEVAAMLAARTAPFDDDTPRRWLRAFDALR